MDTRSRRADRASTRQNTGSSRLPDQSGLPPLERVPFDRLNFTRSGIVSITRKFEFVRQIGECETRFRWGITERSTFLGRTSSSQVPWGLIGMIALVWTSELVCALLVPTSSHRLLGRRARRWRLNVKRRREFSVSGTVRLSSGCCPTLLRDKPDFPATTWPFSGGCQHPVMASSAAHSIPVRRPKAVLVDYNPGLLVTHARVNAAVWPQILGPTEALALFSHSPDFGLALPMIGNCLFHPGNIATAFTASQSRQFSGVTMMSSLAQVRQEKESREIFRGAQPVGLNPSFTEPVTDAIPQVGHKGWKSHPENTAYVHKFMSLAELHQIRVFWVIPPVSPAFQATRFRNGQEDVYDRFVAVIQARHPTLTVLDGRRLGLDRSSFVDTFHMSVRGAELLSEAVAVALGNHLGSRLAGASQVAMESAPAERSRYSRRMAEDSRRSADQRGSGTKVFGLFTRRAAVSNTLTTAEHSARTTRLNDPPVCRKPLLTA